MTATAPSGLLRIGELARRAGTTPRTIRYYEELGLLPNAPARPAGGHRLYSEEDARHVRELMRLRALLGLSLEELGAVVEAEEARAMLRAEFEGGVSDAARLREILTQASGHLDLQLSLVRRRAAELVALQDDLESRRARVERLLAESAES
ncbi:MAG TPA: MerR family transcriptional regulator [Solirubrobacteraceae bacterium]|jgi:DNA-binding transcriptional MerR regulator|nr:MerR family transcriptional regulator [Solirubrobacteraceae bacterium]